MTAQLDLTFGPRSRRRDPSPSHRAAVRATLTAGSHAARIVAALVRWHDCDAGPLLLTTHRLAELCGLTTVQADRRALELQSAGWVTRTDEGLDALCWWPTQRALAWHAERRLP